MKFIDHHPYMSSSKKLFEIPIILNYFSKKLLFDTSSFAKKSNENVVVNYNNNDIINVVVDKIDNYLLNSINYRLGNIERNNNPYMSKNTIKNQKIRDIIIILKIYRSHIDDESKDEVISLIKKNLNDKTEWLNQRIQNNNKKLLALSESYQYYSKYVNNGKTKKMIHVKNKMHEHYNTEIINVKNRIRILHRKLSMLEYFSDNIENASETTFINRYIKVFIDDKLNENNDFKNNLNDVLLYLHYISGNYYEDIKLPSKVYMKSPSNTNTICEIRALRGY